MSDLCSGLMFLVLVLGLIALLGHAIWVGVAAVFSAVTDGSAASRTGERLRRCAGCGATLLDDEPECYACGLDSHGKAASELRELEITARRLQTLRESGVVDESSCERVYGGIEGRVRAILEQATRRPVPVVLPTARTSAQRLDRLLSQVHDHRRLTLGNRRQAMTWHGETSEGELRHLSPQTLLNLARLLHREGEPGRSLEIYRILVEVHPRSEQALDGALEGGLLARRMYLPEVAKKLYEHALTFPLALEDRHEVERSLARLSKEEEERPAAAAQAIPVAVARPPAVEIVSPAEIPDAVAPSVQPAPRAIEPPPPKRTWGQLLAAFMEERNILWGELVGGLLIVGCSIALVISLWQTLEQIPYFPFLIFAAVTGSLFGAGAYTLRHWKLEATSRGLLVIATLLVPLNFLILAGLYRGGERGLLDFAIEGAAVLVFGALVHWAARILFERSLSSLLKGTAWLLTLAVLGPCLAQLATPKLLDPAPAAWVTVLLGLAAAGCHAAALAPVLGATGRADSLTRRHSAGVLLFAGVAVFALGLALGFLVYRCDDLGLTLTRLALPAAVMATTLAAVGAVLRRGTDSDTEDVESVLTPGMLRATGTGMLLTGSAMTLASLALAWPSPAALIAVGLWGAVALTLLGIRSRVPLMLPPAMACLAVAYLVAIHLAHGELSFAERGQGETLIRLARDPLSGVALVPLVAVLAGVAELLARSGRLTSPLVHLGTAILAIVSLLLIISEGVATPARGVSAFGVYGLGLLAINVRWRRAGVTHAGSLLLFGGLIYALVWLDPDLSWQRLLLLAFLTHATLGLLVAWLLRSVDFEESFRQPFRQAALVASLLALPAELLALRWDGMTEAAVTTAWLAGVWLVLAWRLHAPPLFTGFQLATIAALLFAVTELLQRLTWVNQVEDLLTPDALHAYGIALGVLASIWAALRWALRGSETAQVFLAPGILTVDRLLLPALVLPQLFLAVLGILPVVLHELGPRQFAVVIVENGLLDGGAWLWLGVLLLATLAAFWENRSLAHVPLLILLAVTVPVLAADWFREDQAATLALSWGLAGCYLLCSTPLWWWQPLAPSRVRLEEDRNDLSTVIRGMLVTLAAVPALVLPAITAELVFADQPPLQPLDGSFFAALGQVVALAIPPLLVVLTFAGYALRLPSAGYAFAGGVVACLTWMGGHALAVVLRDGSVVTTTWVQILQYGGLGAALWLLAWLVLRRGAGSTDLQIAQEKDGWTLFLTAQAWIAAGFQAALLLGALGGITLTRPTMAAAGSTYGVAGPWSLEAGSPLGWLSIAVTVLAAVACGWRIRGTVHEALVTLAGLGAVILMACTVEHFYLGWGYRVLMLGAAFFGLGWSLITTERRTVQLREVPALLALLLGTAAALVYRDQLFGAGTLLLVGATFAILALRRRREGEMFAATLALMLATSFVVWYLHEGDPIESWWVALNQAVLTTAGLSALVWLALRRRLYRGDELAVGESPLLGCVIGVAFTSNAVVLILAVFALLVRPGIALPVFLEEAGGLMGWTALLSVLVATLTYLRHATPGGVVHALGGGGLKLGALLACSVQLLAAPGSWLAQHVLTSAWGCLGLAMLLAGWAGSSLRAIGPAFWTQQRRERMAELLGRAFPVTATRHWTEGVAVLVACLALRGVWGDPTMPYGPSLGALAASTLFGGLALWSRRPLHVYLSGLLVCLIGLSAWRSWATERIELAQAIIPPGELFAVFVYIEAICLALASVAWSLLDLALRRRTPPVDLRGGGVPFCYFAALFGLHLLAALVIGGLVCDLSELRVSVAAPVGWVALALTADALLLAFWDADAPNWAGMPLTPLYFTGLTAVALGIHTAGLQPERLLWVLGPAFAGYVLLAATLAAAPGWRGLLRAIRAADPDSGWPVPGFLSSQTVLASVAVLLSFWTVFSFAEAEDRLAGPVSVALTALAAAFLARPWAWLSETSARIPRTFALCLAGLAMLEAAWTTIAPGELAWLDRSATALVVLTVLAVIYGNDLAWLVRRHGEWAACARRLTLPLLQLACAALVVLLTLEFLLYDPTLMSTPLARWLVWLVPAALILLQVGGLLWAVVPGRDPLRLSQRGRQFYVYGVEVLLAALLLHLRLHHLLPRINGPYWAFVVMGVAFLGVGLAEWLHRRGLTVLADPLRRTGLFLPILPLGAFLLEPLARLEAAIEIIPGLEPLARYLTRVSGQYGVHALIWLLLAGLYVLVAVTRRSSIFGLLAALAANFGLWVLLAHYPPLAFALHPQVWLMPLALIVLAAEHLSRDRMKPGEAAALRYLGLLLLYVSSAADMFIAGLGNSVLLPVVLAVLSVLGVLAGILLRVRAFMLLGISFLFLVVFAQIWHAAVDRAQTWVWWASGIVLGAAILALFALFEKRRNDVLRVIEEIKRWD